MAISTGKSGTTLLHALFFSILIVTATSGSANAASQMEELAERVGVRILAEATSDKDVLEYTRTRVPLEKMSPAAQKRAAAVLSDISQYRRMPSLQYEVNPDIYQYFINHPDVAVSTWRVMGISKLQMKQVGEFQYEASAGDGSTGTADVLWRDGNQCLFIVQGTYVSPLLPGQIQAAALIWLQYRFMKLPDGKVVVNQQIEAFIQFPSATVDTLARFATRITNTILDRNAFEVSLYAQMMSKAAVDEPDWIEQLARQMDGVYPQRRIELVQVCQGQAPDATLAQSCIVSRNAAAASQLNRSGAFRSFETSLSQVNAHVPLVPNELSQQPAYGSQIPVMGTPQPTITFKPRPEAPEQLTTGSAFREPVNMAVVPPSVLQGKHPAVAADPLEDAPELSFAKAAQDPKLLRKPVVDTVAELPGPTISPAADPKTTAATAAKTPVTSVSTSKTTVQSGSVKTPKTEAPSTKAEPLLLPPIEIN